MATRARRSINVHEGEAYTVEYQEYLDAENERNVYEGHIHEQASVFEDEVPYDPDIDDDTTHFNIDTNIHDLQSFMISQEKPKSRPTGQNAARSPYRRFTVSMDRETWVSLSAHGKAKWDTIPLADKTKILKGTQKRGVELYLQNQGRSIVIP